MPNFVPDTGMPVFLPIDRLDGILKPYIVAVATLLILPLVQPFELDLDLREFDVDVLEPRAEQVLQMDANDF